MSPVEHTHKRKNCVEETGNSVQQPVRALRMKLIKIIEGDFVGKRSPVLTRKIIRKFIIDCLKKESFMLR